MVILDKYNAMFRHKLSLINMIGNKGGGAFLGRNCNIYNVDNVSGGLLCSQLFRMKKMAFENK